MRTMARWATGLTVAVGMMAIGAATAAAQGTTAAPFGTSAVVLVGGFNSSSPFSTPACATADRGPTWGEPTGPAAAISAAGYPVFTVPIANAGTPLAASCLGGSGYPDIPGPQVALNSNGALAGNQAALVGFLAFLNGAYGVTSVQLVGHSDGGLWSRAAITELRAVGSPVTVTNLTTVGTPHLGSFGADVAEDLNADGGSCADITDPIEETVCTLVFDGIGTIIDQLGPDVIEELSSTWLSQWNPTTTIGCPVTVIDGDYVGWSLDLGYYTPNDGIVGQASALNQATLIPFLAAAPFTPVAPPAGQPQSFDVVHSESLAFLSASNELNTAAVATAIAASVSNPPSTPCVAGTAPAAPPAPVAPTPVTPEPTPSTPLTPVASAARVNADAGAAGPSASAAAGPSASGAAGPSAPLPASAAAATPVTVTLPMRHRDAVRNGTLRPARSGDAVLLLKGASVRCGSAVLPSGSLLGSSAVRVVVPRCSRPMTVRGRALHLARATNTVRLRRDGRTLRWSVTGGGVRDATAQLRVDGRWRAVDGPRLTVPAARHEPALRVTARDRHGRTIRAFTRIAV